MEKSNREVVIIDYGLGNLFSVNQAMTKIGLYPIISSNWEEIENADAIILPGVGAFKDAMENLQKLNLVQPIKNFINSGKPFFGICLGLQLLFSESEEFGNSSGLNIIEGKVVKFRNAKNDVLNFYKVPQISWNSIKKPEELSWQKTPLFNINENENFYFVHSYYVVPTNADITLTTTEYAGVKYVSSIFYKNIFACQFHPEKSAEEGIKIYRNWARQNNLII